MMKIAAHTSLPDDIAMAVPNGFKYVALEQDKAQQQVFQMAAGYPYVAVSEDTWEYVPSQDYWTYRFEVIVADDVAELLKALGIRVATDAFLRGDR